MSPNTTQLWLALRSVPKLGPVSLHQLLDQHGNAENIWQSLSLSPAERVEYLDRAKVEQELCDQQNIKILTITDNDYPDKIKQFRDMPVALYLRGHLPQNWPMTIAVVGSRAASPYGKDATQTLVKQLVAQNILVISGLAKGIDGISHQAALAHHSPTIAILGSGLDQIYPPEHAQLAKSIEETGALISQFPPGVPASNFTFPARNRLMAALADAVLVTEAKLKSGSLLTAQAARDYHKPVFAVPGSIFHPGSQGTNRLLQTGAHPVLTAADIVEMLGQAAVKPPAPRPTAGHSAPEITLIQLLEAGPRHIDELIRHSGLASTQVLSLMLQLELSGTVKQAAAGEYRLETPNT